MIGKHVLEDVVAVVDVTVEVVVVEFPWLLVELLVVEVVEVLVELVVVVLVV